MQSLCPGKGQRSHKAKNTCLGRISSPEFFGGSGGGGRGQASGQEFFEGDSGSSKRYKAVGT